jgi:hypothetical protein
VTLPRRVKASRDVPGAKLGGFRGMAVGLGPEIGFIIPLPKGYQGYLNLRGYKDLETENRANTWSTWVTFAISPALPEPAAKALQHCQSVSVDR